MTAGGRPAVTSRSSVTAPWECGGRPPQRRRPRRAASARCRRRRRRSRSRPSSSRRSRDNRAVQAAAPGMPGPDRPAGRGPASVCGPWNGAPPEYGPRWSELLRAGSATAAAASLGLARVAAAPSVDAADALSESAGMSRAERHRTRRRRPALRWLGIAWALPAAAPVVATTIASTAIFSRRPWASMLGVDRCASASASKLSRTLSPVSSRIRSRSAGVQPTASVWRRVAPPSTSRASRSSSSSTGPRPRSRAPSRCQPCGGRCQARGRPDPPASAKLSVAWCSTGLLRSDRRMRTSHACDGCNVGDLLPGTVGEAPGGDTVRVAGRDSNRTTGRGGRVVECGGLENRYGRFTSIEGSNPSPSAE